MTSYLLLAVGLLMIFFEFFLPGGILGVAGGVLIVVSIVLFAIHAESLWAILLFVIVALVLLGALVQFALWRIRTGRGPKSLYLHTDQEGYVASSFAKDFIGKEGDALSDLKPSGHILVEGKRLQAVAKIGYIHKGTKIVVIGGEGAHLVVKTKENKS
ncbi:MAG: hypothetical protein KR126chlam2_01239 [Chlamydiae bacterium]|nr:hypothetical protein [Chlamydiota bacterium]